MTSAASEPVVEQATVEALSSIWQRLLGHDSFDPDESFFDVGGHSLVANSLCLAIEKSFGVQFSVLDVFDHPTLNDQLRRINSAQV